LRILFVADDEAESSLRLLLDPRDQPASLRVSDRDALARALADAEWDAVVAAQPFAPLSIETIQEVLRDSLLETPVIAASAACP
jgi:hypothetical protein